jgi:2-desacetyl-2-hydroxyethyl bacteriochlorophyllide A dehydrogenase
MPTTRGAFMVGPEALQIRQLDLPPPGAGQVQLQVTACGVCGSDLHQLAGRWPQPEVVPGHEIAAIVEECGPGVTDLQRGDPVCVEPIVRCGHCRYCLTGRYLLCETGQFISVQVHGGFAERMVVPAYCCLKLAPGLPVELGALAEPLSVGLHAVRIAAPSGADTVLVVGAGTIGLMTVAAARAMGAGRVLVTARYSHQADAARALGADQVLPAKDFAALIRDACPEGPDVIVDTVGTVGGAIQEALELARKLGTVVLVGGATGPVSLDLGPIIFRELRVLGSPCYGQIGLRRDFEIAAELISTRRVDVAPLITGRYPLAQIAEAFRDAADKRAGALKVLVTGSR